MREKDIGKLKIDNFLKLKNDLSQQCEIPLDRLSDPQVISLNLKISRDTLSKAVDKYYQEESNHTLVSEQENVMDAIKRRGKFISISDLRFYCYEYLPNIPQSESSVEKDTIIAIMKNGDQILSIKNSNYFFYNFLTNTSETESIHLLGSRQDLVGKKKKDDEEDFEKRKLFSIMGTFS